MMSGEVETVLCLGAAGHSEQQANAQSEHDEECPVPAASSCFVVDRHTSSFVCRQW